MAMGRRSYKIFIMIYLKLDTLTHKGLEKLSAKQKLVFVSISNIDNPIFHKLIKHAAQP